MAAGAKPRTTVLLSTDTGMPDAHVVVTTPVSGPGSTPVPFVIVIGVGTVSRTPAARFSVPPSNRASDSRLPLRPVHWTVALPTEAAASGTATATAAVGTAHAAPFTTERREKPVAD